MIFKQVKEIVNGTKTQTRRVIKPGEEQVFDDNWPGQIVTTPSGRIKWEVGRHYAVQPGRGKPCYIHDDKPLRIKILSINSEPVQNITRDDAWFEGISGFSSRPITDYHLLWDSINKRAGVRWEDNPFVWVIKFEVCGNAQVFEADG